MVPRKPKYRYIYTAGLLLSIHYAFTVYINSTFLSGFFSSETINSLYMMGSIITLFCLIWSSRFLNWFGNLAMFLSGIVLETAALLTLAFSHDIGLIKIAFIAHHALPALLAFGMDIFFEGTLASKNDTERVHANFATFVNSAFVIAPFIVGLIISQSSYSIVYSISAMFLLILSLFIFEVFWYVKPKKYREVGFIDSLRKFIKRDHLTGIMATNFVLQCFYVVMVIFMAPYLHLQIGLDWASIGIIFTIMLLPFVIFTAPLGRLFTRFHDERDVLITGFLIIAISLFIMAMVTVPSIWVWATLLFISRVGASFVEAASEAAFFKRVTDQDAGFIGVFRLSAPLAYIITPFIISLMQPALSVPALLTILGIIVCVGVRISYKLKI